MKIALLTHYFWPELGAPSARLLEMGREWAARGHEVTVVTNFPNHPTGVVHEAYRGRTFMMEDVQGLRVLRCRTYATPNRGILKRTLGHLVFMWQAVWQATPHLRSDVLVASSPTLFAVVAAWVISRRLRVPYVFEVRDLWPAIFVDLGVIRNRLVIACLERLELFLYGRAGAVVTVTRAFADDIARRGIARSKLHVVPNGVDLEAFQPGPRDLALRVRLGCTEDDVLVLYCGAHGISHALARVLEAAARLRDQPALRFLFVGEGAEKDALVERARALGLANVAFQASVPREEVAALYRAADICLVPLRAVPLFRSFIPSKMFEILACGRPILASLEGEAAEILRASGAAVVVPTEDVEAMVHELLRLAADPGLRRELAARGRPYVAEHFDRRALAARYLETLEAVARGAAL